MKLINAETRLSRTVMAALAGVLTLGLVAAPASADDATGTGTSTGTSTGTDTGTGTGTDTGTATQPEPGTVEAVIARLGEDAEVADLLVELSEELKGDVDAVALIESRDVYEFRIDLASLDSKKRKDAREKLLEELEDADDTLWVASEEDTTASATRFHAWPVDGTWDEDAVSATVDHAFDLSSIHAVAQGEGAVVAVLDSGFDIAHPALAGRMVDGFDLVDDDADVSDVLDGLDNDGDGQVDEGYGHGTFVSGLVLQIAPHAQILPIRVLDSDGAGRSHTITEGINLAIERGADVINLSFGMSAGDEPKELRKALKRAKGSGVVVVVAAGNTNKKDPKLIGRDEKVISVAASTGSDGVLAGFSSYGKKVTVAAPGIDVVSAVPGGGFATWSGSSMAAPIVAGQAALLMALAPGSSNSEDGDVRDWIKKSARKHSKSSGKRTTKQGLIDIAGSIERLIDDHDLDIDFHP